MKLVMHGLLPPNLEEFAAAEERREALGFVTEAFAEAVLAGVEGTCFAHAAIAMALQELVETFGEEQVAAFANGLTERIRLGEFSLRSRH